MATFRKMKFVRCKGRHNSGLFLLFWFTSLSLSPPDNNNQSKSRTRKNLQGSRRNLREISHRRTNKNCRLCSCMLHSFFIMIAQYTNAGTSSSMRPKDKKIQPHRQTKGASYLAELRVMTTFRIPECTLHRGSSQADLAFRFGTITTQTRRTTQNNLIRSKANLTQNLLHHTFLASPNFGALAANFTGPFLAGASRKYAGLWGDTEI